MTRILCREEAWGVEPGALDGARSFVSRFRDPEFVAALATEEGPRHLDADFELVRDTFRRFAEQRIAPVAETVHRDNADIPAEVISGLAEMGGFGLSVPEEYGGFASGGESDYLGMVVATEELSRASLGVGGSLITRPEILTRALVRGGTEEQKQHWLPRIASAEAMVAVAVTEPDYGSDVAGVKVTATAGSIGLGDQWRQDLVHLRRPRRHLDAAGPHRSRPLQVASGAQHVHRAQAAGRRPRLRVRSGRPRGPGRRSTRGPPDRHHRLPRACTPTSWPSIAGGFRETA